MTDQVITGGLVRRAPNIRYCRRASGVGPAWPCLTLFTPRCLAMATALVTGAATGPLDRLTGVRRVMVSPVTGYDQVEDLP